MYNKRKKYTRDGGCAKKKREHIPLYSSLYVDGGQELKIALKHTYNQLYIEKKVTKAFKR